jgi:phenylacetate-coenzyme A ligase PaaK-like adenylate-forming protein
MKLSLINSFNFAEYAMKVFSHQAKNNRVYNEFIDLLKIDPEKINRINEIPFLPVDFFKTHKVLSTKKEPDKVFLSSGTSMQQKSRHYVTDLSLYEDSFLSGFEYFYGKVTEYCILALLPSYLENPNSSLVYMVDKLIAFSKNSGSRYLTGSEEQTAEILQNQQKSGKKTIVIGVTYALLDLAEKFPGNYSNIIFMETGGMKGRRKEITREELHTTLQNAFNVSSIHSEYGMSELLSQAYSKGNGIFECPPWMKVYTRPLNEPFGKCSSGETGVVQIIDLANQFSCSFIETADLGRVFEDNSFEILGRVDYAEIRGCNLLVE